MRRSFALVLSTALGLTALTGAALAERGPGLFERSDSNGDGFVSKEEFAAGRTTMFGKLDANADGSIDQGEIKRITGRLESEGAAPEAREFIGQEMLKPMDMDALIRRAQTPQAAVEVYAASLLAIEVDTPAERDYLRRLAEGLALAPTTVQRVHEALGVAAPA